MSYYTVTQQSNLISGTDPVSVISSVLTPTSIVNVGDLVTVASPPVTSGDFTQVTTANGTVGWVPTSSITPGFSGSNVMDLAVVAGLLVAAYFFFLRK